MHPCIRPYTHSQAYTHAPPTLIKNKCPDWIVNGEISLRACLSLTLTLNKEWLNVSCEHLEVPSFSVLLSGSISTLLVPGKCHLSFQNCAFPRPASVAKLPSETVTLSVARSRVHAVGVAFSDS